MEEIDAWSIWLQFDWNVNRESPRTQEPSFGISMGSRPFCMEGGDGGLILVQFDSSSASLNMVQVREDHLVLYLYCLVKTDIFFWHLPCSHFHQHLWLNVAEQTSCLRNRKELPKVFQHFVPYYCPF